MLRSLRQRALPGARSHLDGPGRAARPPTSPWQTREKGSRRVPSEEVSILRYRAAISFAATALFAVSAASASKAVSAKAAFSALPHWWVRQALCIHRHESLDWHRTTDWRGYPSRDQGGMQIDVGTWAAHAPAGFHGDPAAASPREQLVVAFWIWRANGRRFGGGQWPYSSTACGVE
jgi:Transglycosylase-like domain